MKCYLLSFKKKKENKKKYTLSHRKCIEAEYEHNF